MRGCAIFILLVLVGLAGILAPIFVDGRHGGLGRLRRNCENEG